MKRSLALAFSLGMLVSVSPSMHAAGKGDWRKGLLFTFGVVASTIAIKRYAPTVLGWIKLKNMLGEKNTDFAATGLSIAASGLLALHMFH